MQQQPQNHCLPPVYQSRACPQLVHHNGALMSAGIPAAPPIYYPDSMSCPALMHAHEMRYARPLQCLYNHHQMKK